MKKLISWVFSPEGIFIVPILIILYILGSNFSHLMEKFGYESRTTLKAELVKSQENVRQLKVEIKRLEGQEKLKEKICKMTEDDFIEYNDKDKKINDIIKDILEKPLEKALEKNKETRNKETNTTPDSGDLLVESNYYMVEMAYQKLFGA